jgi:hypothetical protein
MGWRRLRWDGMNDIKSQSSHVIHKLRVGSLVGCAKVSWKDLKQGSYGLEAREGAPELNMGMKMDNAEGMMAQLSLVFAICTIMEPRVFRR